MKAQQKINRKQAKEQGFYDGRYKTKVVPDKKKAANKYKCRQRNTS